MPPDHFVPLAAVLIKPEKAFKFAFGGGADFIAVGMFDFQIVEDTLLVKNILTAEKMKNRKRRWYG